MYKKIFTLLCSAFFVVSLLAQITSYKGYMIAGNSRMQLGQYEEAIQFFEKAKKAPDAPRDAVAADKMIGECKSKIAQKKAKEEEARKQKEKEAARRRQAHKAESQSPQPSTPAKQEDGVESENQEQAPKSCNLLFFSYEILNVNKDGKTIGSTENGSLKARDMRWITPVVLFSNNGGAVVPYQIDIKVFDADGNLKRLGNPNKVREGYSCNVTLTPDIQKPKSAPLFSWGNDNTSIFKQGNYQIELWYNGEMVYSFNFNLI